MILVYLIKLGGIVLIVIKETIIDNVTQIKQVEFIATVTRADGSTEELGTISYWNKNIFKQLLWKIKQWLR